MAIVRLKPAKVSAPSARGRPAIVHQHQGKPVVGRALPQGRGEGDNAEQDFYGIEGRPPPLTSLRGSRGERLRFIKDRFFDRFGSGARGAGRRPE